MLACRCGGKPAPGATRSSLITRSGPKPIHAGSWKCPNENVCRLSSQPACTWPRSAAGRSMIIGLLRGVGLGQLCFRRDRQRDVVAHVGHVLADAEVAALERGGGVEAGRRPAAHRIRANLVDGDVERSE